jgi:hypothetical protein
LSTHAIGTVRLLFGSLVLLLAGAGAMWVVGVGEVPAALVIRGGSLEFEPLFGTLRAEGGDFYWDHAVEGVFVSIYKAEDRDQEFELGEPISQPMAKSIRMGVRVDGRIIEDAVLVTLQEQAVKITVKGVALAKRGDVWVHPGFVQDGRKKVFEIATLELLSASGEAVARYQNPDLGRYFRYRVKLTASDKK